MKHFFRHKSFRVLSAALCAAAISLLCISGCGQNVSGTGSTTVTAVAAEKNTPGLQADVPDTVTVSGKGSVYAAPDRAELRFGIRTQAETAAEAQERNSRSVGSVISALKKSGIKEESIQTTWYDVSPQYDWNTGNGDTIIGYNVSSSLSVKNVNIEEAGALITACTKAGANEFNGISYSCTNYNELYGEALQKAVEASREKAGLLAKAAGRSLGSVAAITEGYQDTTYALNAKAMGSMDGAGAVTEAGSDAALMPGQAEITAAVTVTYVLR